MFFTRKPTKDLMQGRKTVKIGGMRFVIKKINPLLDLPSDKLPSIFTSFVSRRKLEKPTTISNETAEQIADGIKTLITAGVVEPRLVPVGKGEEKGYENGLTVDDIFRDTDIALKLYVEILDHSFNQFKGLRGLFFSMRIKLQLFLQLRKHTEKLRLKYFSLMAITQ